VKVASVRPGTVKRTQSTNDCDKTKSVTNERGSCVMVANEQERPSEG
jgi:hypothetical protein